MQSWNGVIVPPDDYMSKLKRICDNNQILIIDDEVFAGFGRTGKMFGIQNWEIEPDIMCLGKAIGAGMTGSNAIVAGKEMVDSWPDHWGGILSSAAGNLLACVASIAVLDVIRKENLVEHAKRMGQILMEGVSELFSKYELIGDVRGKGLLLGIELVKNRKTKEPAIGKPIEIAHKALKKGLLVEAGAGTYRNILRLIPPLVVTEEDIKKALKILDEAFMEAKCVQ
jgi:4-aminobutyrate aminotransferase-like enzyme